MDLKWNGDVDINTVLTLVLIPLFWKIVSLITKLWEDVKFAKEGVAEIKATLAEWKEKREDQDSVNITTEARLTRIEAVLMYIIPDNVTDSRIAQIFSDSLKKPVSVEEVKRKRIEEAQKNAKPS